MNDEQSREDTLRSAVPQEALVNMPLSVILECEATRSTQRRPRPAGTLYPSGRSSTAHGSERAGRVYGVVTAEV